LPTTHRPAAAAILSFAADDTALGTSRPASVAELDIRQSGPPFYVGRPVRATAGPT